MANFSPAPAAPGHTSAARPTTVNAAFFIYVALTVLALVGIVLAVTSSAFDQIASQYASLVSTFRTTTIIIGVLFAALYLFFAIKMRNGRNWARIVLTVLSVLSVLSRFTVSTTITVDGQTYSASSDAVLGWVSAIAAIVAVVLMFMPASNAYFDGQRRR